MFEDQTEGGKSYLVLVCLAVWATTEGDSVLLHPQLLVRKPRDQGWSHPFVVSELDAGSAAVYRSRAVEGIPQ